MYDMRNHSSKNKNNDKGLDEDDNEITTQSSSTNNIEEIIIKSPTVKN
jgi:hypothetical protein